MSSDDNDDCLICYDKINSDYVYPNNDQLNKKCHLKCIKKWYQISNRGIITQDKVDHLIVYGNNDKEIIIDVNEFNENTQSIDVDNINDTNYIPTCLSSIIIFFVCLCIVVVLDYVTYYLFPITHVQSFIAYTIWACINIFLIIVVYLLLKRYCANN